MQTSKEWDGYPKGSIVKSTNNGIVVEIIGPAERQDVCSIRNDRTYTIFGQASRILKATDEKSADLIAEIALRNIRVGLPAGQCVATMGQFVFYTGDEE